MRKCRNYGMFYWHPVSSSVKNTHDLEKIWVKNICEFASLCKDPIKSRIARVFYTKVQD